MGGDPEKKGLNSLISKISESKSKKEQEQKQNEESKQIPIQQRQQEVEENPLEVPKEKEDQKTADEEGSAKNLQENDENEAMADISNGFENIQPAQ